MLSTNALAQDLQKTISVTGSGTIYAEPDIAMITVSIEVKNRDLGKATNEANNVIAKIKDTLEPLGIAAEDIRTSSFNVWPDQRYDLEGRPTTNGYVVSHSLEVTIRNIENVGEVLSKSINAGANGVSNIRYTFADDSELEEQARAKAMANARAKAEQLAELAEVNITGIMSIREQTNNNTSPATPRFEAMSTVAESVPVSTGQLAVSVSLAVSFLID